MLANTPAAAPLLYMVSGKEEQEENVKVTALLQGVSNIIQGHYAPLIPGLARLTRPLK